MNNKKQQTIKLRQDITTLSRRLQQLSIEQKSISDQIEQIVNSEGYDDNNDTTNKQTRTMTGPTDRTGTPLVIGQTVKLLTIGKFTSTRGKITKIGKAKVTIQLDKTGKSTNRIFKNVSVIQP
jgi:hypothetical protein